MKVALRVPADLLKSRRKDLITLLRLGAGVNSLEVSTRLLAQLETGPGATTTQLARQHFFCAGLAYLGEIVKTIAEEKYEERLFQLVEKGLEFLPLPGISLAEARALLSPTHPHIGGNPDMKGNVLLKIRDKITFHWDRGPFASFVDHPDNAVIDLLTSDREPPDRIFSASAHAVAQFVFEVPQSGTTVEDLQEALVQSVTLVGHAFDAAFFGLIAEVGAIPPTKHLVKLEG